MATTKLKSQTGKQIWRESFVAFTSHVYILTVKYGLITYLQEVIPKKKYVTKLANYEAETK